MNLRELRSRLTVFLGVLLLVTLTSQTTSADQRWPSWRGPQENGFQVEGIYPEKWTTESGVVWKLPIGGLGCSTPIVWDQQIIITAGISDSDTVLSVDWKGDVKWRRTLGKERKGKHRNGSGSNPSPVTNGKGIFVYFKSGNFAALEMNGEIRWQKNLVKTYGKESLFWDFGTSPVLTEDAVIVAMMHGGDSYLIAVDQKTGDTKWKVERNYETPVEVDHSYASPLIYKHKNQERILVWGAAHLTSHSPQDGKVLWSCGEFNPDNKSYWVAVSSAIINDGMVLVPYGRGSRLHGIQLGGSGDVTKTHRKWVRKGTGTFVPTPASYEKNVILVRDQGEVECVSPKTGKTIWEGRLPKHRSKYYSSPLVADGKIYAAREDGKIFVATAKPPFKVLSENDMKERVIASPVAVDNKLLIRGEEHLYCLAKKK